MNKFLLVAILPLLVTILIFKLSNAAVVVNGGTASSSHHARITRIPVHQVKRNCSSGGVKHGCHNGQNNLATQKTKRKRSAAPTATNDTLADEDWGSYWMGLVTIGTPGQPFYVDFDTGSSDLWVPGPQCGYSCGGTNTFQSSSSSTYQSWNKNFYIIYGDGTNVDGSWANDTVNIGGVSIVNQSFAVISSANGMSTRVSDGILGMGYQKLANGGENPVIWSMYLAGELSLPVFGFWFGPISTGSDTGELIIGGYDTTKYTGFITYASVTVQGYWEFVADRVSLTVGSTTTTIATSINAILDTGTTVAIAAPSYYANMINTMLGATYNPGNGLYIVNCQTQSLAAFPNITVTISGVPFTLTPLMYIIITGGPSTYTCYSMITASSATDAHLNPIWILGDFFMRRFYSVFDMQNNRIGLALSTSYSVVQTVPATLFQTTTTLFPPATQVTTSVITIATLPSQCYNYTTIKDPTRLTTYPADGGCDDSSVFNSIGNNPPTYVRFMSPGGTQLATFPPNAGNGSVCGTYAAGWTNATYPSVVGQTVNAFACFAYNGNPCYVGVYYFPITNCNGFYVQGLYSFGYCPFRYCTQ